MNKDFTSKEGVQSFLSTFWTQLFDDRSFIEGLADYHAATMRQVYQDTAEVINSISPATIPVYHLELLFPFELNESQMSVGPLPITYGEGVVFGEQPSGSQFREGEIFEFGGRERRSAFYYFPIDGRVKECGSVIANRIAHPDVFFVRDIDFILGDGIIAFTQNPFLNEDLLPTGVSGNRSLTLWGSSVSFDKKYISRMFTAGYSTVTDSSESLKSFSRALYRLQSEGPTIAAIDSFVAACAEQPISKEDETIESVSTFGGRSLIITDKNAYELPASVSPRSEHVADIVLKEGTPLTAVTRVDDLLSDSTWWRSQPGFTLTTALQAPGHGLGPIFFPNKDVVVSPLRLANGHVSARFELLGDEEAIASFWDYVDSGAAGVYLGEELWRTEEIFTSTYLTFIDGDIVEFLNGDICTRIMTEGWVAIDDETMLDFFSKILMNPMGFLVEKVFRNSLVAIRVDGSRVSSFKRFLSNLKHLKGATTPITLSSFFVDYTVADDYVEHNTAEEMTLGLHLEVEDETIDLATETGEDFLLVKPQRQIS